MNPIRLFLQQSWRRKLIILSVSALTLVLLAVIAVTLYLRSERFNLFVVDQLKATAALYGLKVEVGSLGFSLRDGQAKLKRLRIVNGKTDKLIAEVDEASLNATVLEPYALRLKRTIVLNSLTLDGVKLYLEANLDGTNSFTGLKTPPPNTEPSRILVDINTLVTKITNSTISVKDSTHDLALDLNNINITSTLQGATKTALDIAATGGSLVYKDSRAEIKTLAVKATVDEKGIQLEPSSLNSDLANIAISGQVNDWQKLQHQLKIQVDTKAVTFADIQVKGPAGFQGEVNGDKDNSHLTGRLVATEIAHPKAGITGLDVDKIDLSLFPQISLTTGKVKLDSAKAAPLTAKSIYTADVKGSIVDNKINLNLPQLQVGALFVPQVEASGVQVRNVAIEIVGSEISSNIKQTFVNRVNLRQGQLNKLNLDNIVAEVKGEQYKVDANLTLANGRVDRLQIDNTKGKLELDNRYATLSNLTTGLLGGKAELQAQLALTNKDQSHIQTKFSQIDSAKISTLIEKPDLPVSGQIEGNADLSFPGLDFNRVTGQLNAKVVGQTNEQTDRLPLTANVVVKANSGTLMISPLNAKLGQTDITAQGIVALKPNNPKNTAISFEYKVQANKSEELFTVARKLELLSPTILDLNPSLTGTLNVNGKISGTVGQPTITADITAQQLGLQNNQFQNLNANLQLTPQDLTFAITQLSDGQGGNLNLNFQGKVNDLANNAKLNAQFQNFALKLNKPKTDQEIFNGVVNGQADFNLLGDNSSGKATISLNSSRVANQVVEGAQLELSLNNQIAKIDKLAVKIAGSDITGDGLYNLKTADIQFQSQVKDLNLANLPLNNPLRGIVNASVKINGNANKLEEIQFDLQATTDELYTASNRLGKLSVTAQSDNQGNIKAQVVTYLIPEQPQTINGTLSLREAGYPVEVTSQLNQLDLGLVLTALQVPTDIALHTNISGNLLAKGTIFNDNGEVSPLNFQAQLMLTQATIQFSDQALTIETPTSIAFEGDRICLDRLHIFSGSSDLTLAGQCLLINAKKLDFTANGNINLKDFAGLAPGTSLDGTAQLDVKLGGTVDAPSFSGSVALNNLGLYRDDLPVQVTAGNGVVTLLNDRVVLENFTARANDGLVTGKGQIDLMGFQPTKYLLNFNANDVNLIYQGAAITVKGDFALTGSASDQVLKGNVKVLEAVYNKAFDANLLNSNIITADDGSISRNRFNPRLEISVDADNSIIIKNPQVDTVASAVINVGGKISQPDVTGRITVDGGTLTFRKQKYEITEGIVDIPGGLLVPSVRLIAEGNVNNYRVFISVIGPVDQVDLELSSEPTLTRTEILALITTGRPDVGGGEQFDLATTGLSTGANIIAQEFISKPFGRTAEQLLGLTQFQIDPVIRANENPSARLTLGRQIIPKLNFTYSTSLASNNDRSIVLEYSLSTGFSALFSFTQGGNSTKGESGDNDLGFEIRGRKRFALGGKGEIEKAAVSGRTGFVRPKFPTAQVVVNKPDEIKISEERLEELIPIKKQPFTTPLARVGSENLTNYLQERGYFFAQVTNNCEPGDCQGTDLKVNYNVVPGQRYEIRDIAINGTNLLDGSVKGQLQTKPKNFIGKVPFAKDLPLIGGFAYGVTSNERLRQDSEYIRQQMIDLGYRQAKVSYRYGVDLDGRGLRIKFDVEEGPLNRIGEIVIKEAHIFSAEDIRKVINLYTGVPYSPNAPREAGRQIQDYYAQHGYLDTTLDLSLEEMPNNQIRVIYLLNEGHQARVEEVLIDAPQINNEASVRRFIDLKKGDILTNKSLQTIRRDLYATGNFREIEIRNEVISDTDPEGRRVIVKLTPAKPLLLIYGLGYSTDDGPRGSLELSDTDFRNKIQTGTLRLRLSGREQTLQLQLTDQRPFGSHWETTASTLYTRNSRLGGTINQLSKSDLTALGLDNIDIGLIRYSTFIQTQRKLTDKFTLRFRYNFDLTKLLNVENTLFSSFLDSSRLTRLSVLSAGTTYDSRNNALNPTGGQFFAFDYSLATKTLGGNESFNKVTTNYQYFKKLERSPVSFLDGSVLAFSSRIGLAAPFDIRSRRGDGVITSTDRLLPFSERFRSGGATTLRGFQFETAGPQAIIEVGNAPARLVPIGGDALAVFNFELRYPLSSRLQLVPFYDLGNVFAHIRDISFGNMTNTVGVGLRFNTPIGPVGVDYGYLLDPPSYITPNGGILRQKRGIIHIKFGQSF